MAELPSSVKNLLDDNSIETTSAISTSDVLEANSGEINTSASKDVILPIQPPALPDITRHDCPSHPLLDIHGAASDITLPASRRNMEGPAHMQMDGWIKFGNVISCIYNCKYFFLIGFVVLIIYLAVR